ncbi:hypothetical protein HYH03_010464 [Edaphochlamys debaryana]|uniref:Uncharacterized protein n=1 Tax=Edaphochlamys debaryana TaxID=47281 RepID=A0A835XYA5_9CHLO|nr:hypothetical protein HYH03_010464 [Edaphochlamys debaryana]|eukprot:KAG2491258.1 hypothetical protein HYH03_010464 [Edaphochlamys debaryana]
MTSPQVMSRALNTHQFRKDVQETGAVREKNANNILGKAQESLFNAKAGLRRFFGGSGDKDKGSMPGSEGSEAGGLSVDGSGAVDTSDLSAAAVGKLRRASMTTYTFNLAAAPTGQVEREVRRLAGLEGPGSGVFGRISAAPEAGGGGAAGYDDVEAMTSGRGGRQGDDDDEDDDDSQYAFQGNRAHSGPSPVPVPSTRSHPHPFLGGGQGSQRSLLAQARAHSQGALAAGAAAGAADRMHSIDYVDDPAAEPLPDIRPRLGKPGSSSQLLIPSGQGSPGAGPSPLGQGQLGSMRDRKPRNGTNEGFLTASGSASPGPMSPGTPNPGPLGMGLGGNGSASPQGMSHVPRLPTLSSPLSVTTPRASGSQHQLSGLGSGPNAIMAMSPSDSRPDSGRPWRAPSHTHGLRPGGEGEGSAHSPGNHSHHGYMGGGGGGGGRWMQQDSDDVASMLAAAGGDADMLHRIMAGGDVGPDGGEAGGLHLPRLGGGGGGGGGADDHAAAERAAERLEQLRKFQDNLDTQLARERQAVATGKVRRSSVLEDAYGHQQPRWQNTFNPEAQSMHGKLSAVDPLRRSEFDNPRLAKFGKELKSGSSGGPGGSGSAASASPVVARARRLSTVMA